MDPLKVEKRNRPPKSCEPCRIRKRGKDLVCQYAANADRKDRGTHKVESVTDRLKNLEDIISSIMQNNTRANNPPLESAYGPSSIREGEPDQDHDPSPSLKGAVETHGGILPRDNQASYVDSSHWSSILEDIKGIRELLPQHDHEQISGVGTPTLDSERTWVEGNRVDADLVFGFTQTPYLQQILISLPPRQVCDGLVSHYFQMRYTVLPILHPAKFQNEYEAFWDSPTTTPPIWIALLFAMLSLAASLQELSDAKDNPEKYNPSPKVLSKRTEQCLVLGRYAGASRYSIEALMIHLQSCYIRAKDSDVNLWLLLGVIIPLAVRLGYHRDPAKLVGSTLSQFDGEMRRRIWLSIFQIDTLVSFQMGLPSMIPSENCDTEMPRNLEYSDFYPETQVLPPSRPVTDRTSILYTIAKAPVLTMFKAIVAHTRSLTSPPYDKTMALDRKARDIHNALPDAFEYKPLRTSIMDGPGIIMNRVTIEMLHQKSIIILHRQYITSHRQDSSYDPSRRALLHSALTILERQSELHQATQSGGQLHHERWMVSALTASDFILAAMIICLEVTIRMREKERQCSDVKGHTDSTRLLTALRTSHQIWIAASAYSKEARVAAQALESTIQRVNADQNTHPQPQATQTSYTATPDIDDVNQVEAPFTWQTTEAIDGMEFINWGLLDNPIQGHCSDEFNLDSWIMDAAWSSGLGDML